MRSSNARHRKEMKEGPLPRQASSDPSNQFTRSGLQEANFSIHHPDEINSIGEVAAVA